MTYSEAMETATQIISCYPHGGRDAGESYLGAIASVLTDYPRQVVIACADPRKGVAQTTKFLPTVAELVAWCEEKVAPLYTQEVREQRIEQQFREREAAAIPRIERPNLSTRKIRTGQGVRANLHVLKEAPQYTRVLEMTEILPIEDWRIDERGVWISLYHFQGALNAITVEQRLAKVFPAPQPQESDRNLKASPALVKSLKERDDLAEINRRLDQPRHWSDG